MKKLLALAALLALFPLGVRADTYEALPATAAVTVWDTTTGTFYAIGINGQGATTTTIPTLTGVNNFTGTLEINGVAQVFPTSGLLVGTTDTQTLTNKTLTSPVATGLTVPSGGVAVGTTTASTVPLTLVGLGTTSPEPAADICVLIPLVRPTKNPVAHKGSA